MNPDTSGYADAVRQDDPGNIPVHGYAGFWKRYAAFFIDGIILSALISIISAVQEEITLSIWQVAEKTIIVIMIWLYFALFERSSSQATPGKMALGINVTDMNGNRISFGRASGRHFSKILSFLSFLVGYFMAAFTQKKQGLHDIVAECLVVNKHAPTPSRNATAVMIATLGVIIFLSVISSAVFFPAMSNAILKANMKAMSTHARDIYAAMAGVNTAREPIGRGTVWPKAGNTVTLGDDISKMTFGNSTDYFNALHVVMGFDYSKCAGAVVTPSTQDWLTAQNNAWTIAANVTDDMPDTIPVILSRNVDPASLIPREGDDLCQQFIRPSEKFRSPFGNRGFVIIRKGGAVTCYTKRYTNLDSLYFGASEAELQKIREALQKIEYLSP